MRIFREINFDFFTISYFQRIIFNTNHSGLPSGKALGYTLGQKTNPVVLPGLPKWLEKGL
jgi:hypothetical protein